MESYYTSFKPFLACVPAVKMLLSLIGVARTSHAPRSRSSAAEPPMTDMVSCVWSSFRGVMNNIQGVTSTVLFVVTSQDHDQKH
eukprot:3555804-Amphidinium_carterae.2